MSKAIILEDTDDALNRPLTRFRSIFSLRNGIFTSLERIRLANPKRQIYFRHPDEVYEALIADSEGMIRFKNYTAGVKSERTGAEALNPFLLIDEIGNRIGEDLNILKRLPIWNDYICAGREKKKIDLFQTKSIHILGSEQDLYFHRSVEIMPGVVFDTRKGPILIDENAKISPFSHLNGPLYIGKKSSINRAVISGNSIIGHQVKASGEIENSIIGDYSNKHHEGFLGHSIIGSWVNLGALTTTSDLKNNYGEVRLHLPTANIPDGEENRNEKLEIFRSGRIKFGAILGDFVKTAIGTMISTGSVIDAASSIFGGNPKKYVPPFCWGDEKKCYELNKFLNDCQKIFFRRNFEPHPNFKELAANLYNQQKI